MSAMALFEDVAFSVNPAVERVSAETSIDLNDPPKASRMASPFGISLLFLRYVFVSKMA